jgi:hypothetical protein
MQKRNTQKSPQKNAEKEHAEETHKRGAKVVSSVESVCLI